MAQPTSESEDLAKTFVPPRRLEVPAWEGRDGYIIRAYELNDAELKLQTTQSFEHLRPWMSWVREHETLDESQEVVKSMHAKFNANEDFAMAITSLDGSKLVGGTGFHLREGLLDTQCAEIGMWIAEDLSGKGCATHVLRSMLAWGFSEWGFLRLSWHCDALNIASRRVAEKAGMLYEGTLRGQKAEARPGRRDTLLFAALKDEWE